MGLFMEVSGSLWSYWTWENISHSQAVFYFWKSKAHIYFTEHLSYAGQILLFFSFLVWARYKSNTKQHLSFFLYHTLAMCLQLIIFHPPVHKLNASGTKIGIQCEVGVPWSSRVPSMSGSVFVRLSLLGSFNHQTCHYIVILQSTFFSDSVIWVWLLAFPQHWGFLSTFAESTHCWGYLQQERDGELRMWSAGIGKGRNLSRGWKKSPLILSRCVYLLFFSFLCYKDEILIQMAQINADRDKNKGMIAGNAQS